MIVQNKQTILDIHNIKQTTRKFQNEPSFDEVNLLKKLKSIFILIFQFILHKYYYKSIFDTLSIINKYLVRVA